MKTKLSIIICTYNRSDILEFCLNSLTKQTANKDLFELIVVDNNSTDKTKELCLTFQNKFVHFQYIKEKEVGLSYARNTGYKNANSDWVAYIDDDTIAHDNYIERAINTMEKYQFDCFGGKFYPWFMYPRKKWLPKNFGLKEDLIASVGEIKQGYLTGCNMLFKKDILFMFEGFNTNLGMTGDKVAFGEETELQDKIRNAGFSIGYDPELCIDHLVGKHKLTLIWHLKASYAYGRDNYRMWKNCLPNFRYLLKTTIKSILGVPKKIILIILKAEYYWQNAYLEVFKPIYQAMGEYNEYKRSKSLDSKK